MLKLQRKIKSTDSFLVNDKGKLVTIKQPTIMELQIFNQAIIANKQIINTVFRALKHQQSYY